MDDRRWPRTLLDALCPLVEAPFRHGFLLLLIHDFHHGLALEHVQSGSHPHRVAVCLADRRVRFVLVEPLALASELDRSWKLGRSSEFGRFPAT